MSQDLEGSKTLLQAVAKKVDVSEDITEDDNKANNNWSFRSRNQCRKPMLLYNISNKKYTLVSKSHT